MKEQKTTWDILSNIDCSAHTEKKNNLTYLSWAWAWGITKKNFPSANYEITMWDNKPYLFDADLGYLIQTTVSIDGEKITMQLPVMDGSNKAQKNVEYTYQTKSGEKTVNAATMFDINTAIMRCLVKNLAMFGLGHYIYAGEDLPMDLKSVAEMDAIIEEIESLRPAASSAATSEELSKIWFANQTLQGEVKFKQMINEYKIKLEKQGK